MGTAHICSLHPFKLFFFLLRCHWSNTACQILFGSRYKSSTETLASFTARLEASRITTEGWRRLWPLSMNVTSEQHSCLSPCLPLCLSDLLLVSGLYDTVMVGERRQCLRGEKALEKVTGVKGEGIKHFFCSVSDKGVRIERCGSTLPVWGCQLPCSKTPSWSSSQHRMVI